MRNGEDAVRSKEEPKRFGWKSYVFTALVAGLAARKYRKQLSRVIPFYQSHAEAGQQNETRWYTPSEADLWQEHMDEIERKERERRVQEVYHARRSSFRSARTVRYEKWEEHPQKEETPNEKKKNKFEADRAESIERARLRHHYIVLGLNPEKLLKRLYLASDGGLDDALPAVVPVEGIRREKITAFDLYAKGQSSSSMHSSLSCCFRNRPKPGFRDEAFTEDEIKAAFREKAQQYHPDKNPDTEEETRAKFRELVDSYKAIKLEKNII